MEEGPQVPCPGPSVPVISWRIQEKMRGTISMWFQVLGRPVKEEGDTDTPIVSPWPVWPCRGHPWKMEAQIP